MDKKQVFISYKAEEFEQADWVRSTLENNGISCWMAPMCIPGGSSYAVEIPQAIRECKVFVLILSEKCQLSKWVPRELDQAINEGKLIMPFMLEDCDLKDDFNFYLTNVQRYKAYESKAATISKMISEIKAVLGEDSPAELSDEKTQSDETPIENIPSTESITARPKSAATAKPKVKKQPKAKVKKAPIKKIVSLLSALLILFALIITVNLLDHITIGGVRFSKSDGHIDLNGAEITREDIEKLGKFKRIYAIEFTDCRILASDLSGIASDKICSLTLSGCNLTKAQLESIDFKIMSNLDTLNLSKNPELDSINLLKDINPELFNLYIDKNNIDSLEGIPVFEKLEVLSVSGNSLESLKGIESFIHLKKIYASENKLTSLSGLENTTLLETVDFSFNSLTDISLLERSAENLRKVYLQSNLISELSPLKTCFMINYLNLDTNKLASLADLEALDWLVAFSAADNQISSLEGLSGTKELEYINLSGNRLTDVRSLTFADKYITARFDNNSITNIELPQECYYRYLFLHNNPLSIATSIYGCEGSVFTLKYADGIEFESLADAFASVYVTDCPQDKKVAVEESLGIRGNFNSDEISQALIPESLISEINSWNY
ncbi:MAG: TIR domain-containing protein [Clostridia bacterium]|nr:TIR domain-containing protein [Clostridia bacterium]